MGVIEGGFDFLVAVIAGLIAYIFITIGGYFRLNSWLMETIVIMFVAFIGALGLRIFIRIYSLLYEKE